MPMSYEGPRPSAESPSTEKDDSKPSKKKSGVSGTAMAREAVSGGSEAAPKKEPSKPAWDLGKLVGKVVSEPKTEKAPASAAAEKATPEAPEARQDKPDQTRKDEATAEVPGSHVPTAEDSPVEKTDVRPEAEARDTATDAENHGEAAHEADNAERDPSIIEKDEQQEVADRLIEPRLQALRVEQEAAEPDSVKAQVAATDATYLAAVQARVGEGADLETATAAAFPEVLGVDAPPLPEMDAADATAEGETDAEETAQPAPMPVEALDFPAPTNPNDDPYAAPYGTGFGGGAGGFAGGGGAAPTAGYAGGYGGGAPGRGFGIGGWNRARANQAPRVEVSGVASGLVVGGIVGWLLGNRHGRRKTEKRLLPIQRQLERQVQTLHNHLTAREEQVRKLARERLTGVAAPVMAEAAPHRAASERTGTSAAPAAERITQVVSEQSPDTKAAAKPEVRAKNLPLKEVLEISETIVVGSTTIRRVYETSLVDEAGLRKIVDEHLRGGDVHKVLTEELILKELSYERDPLMNPRADEETATQEVQGGGATNGLGGINPLLPQASASQPAVQRQAELAFTGQQQSISPALVMANIAALAILALLLIVLLVVWLTR